MSPVKPLQIAFPCGRLPFIGAPNVWILDIDFALSICRPTLAAVSPSDSHHSLFQTPQALRTTITASPSGTADNPEQNTSISFVNAVKSVLPTPPASEIPKVVTPHAVQISATRLKFAVSLAVHPYEVYNLS